MDDRVHVEFFDVPSSQLAQTPPKLEWLATKGLPKRWILPFLSPSITHFELGLSKTLPLPATNLLHYLSRIPSVTTIGLDKIRLANELEGRYNEVRLPQLTDLEVHQVLYAPFLLSKISAPSLRTLSVRERMQLDYSPHLPWTSHNLTFPEFEHFSPFFSQWSQPSSLPSQLRCLELANCLQVSDVPYLIRWLARLPSLTRLILRDDALGRAAESEDISANIFHALAVEPRRG